MKIFEASFRGHEPAPPGDEGEANRASALVGLIGWWLLNLL
jgi:hypothetical protein